MQTFPHRIDTIYAVPSHHLAGVGDVDFLSPLQREFVLLSKELDRLRLDVASALISNELPRHCMRIRQHIDLLLDQRRVILSGSAGDEGQDWVTAVLKPAMPNNDLIRSAADPDNPNREGDRKALALAFNTALDACEARARKR